jgi:hypothetical protein
MKRNLLGIGFGGVCLLLVAATFITLGDAFRQALTPFYLLNWDPDYAYLFNGMAIYSGSAPTHIDHPGTTLQLVITAFLALQERGSSATELYLRVIEDPEWYLIAISHGLVIGIAVMALLLGIVVWLRFESLPAALLAPAGVLISPAGLLSLGRVTPEPLVLMLSCALLAVAVGTLHRKRGDGTSVGLVPSAWVVGAGLATKLTFLPVLAVGYYFVQSKAVARRWVLLIVAAFLVFTVPWLLYWKTYFNFLRWFTRLSFGSGIYGEGPRTIIDASLYLPNLVSLAEKEWMYAIVVLVASVFAWLDWRKSRGEEQDNSARDRRRLLHALLLVHLFCFLLVAKHPQATRYMIPGVAMAGFTLALAIINWGCQRTLMQMRGGLILAVGVVAGMGFLASQRTLEATHQAKARVVEAYAKQLSLLAQEPLRSCVRVHRDSATPEFAYHFGLVWGKARTDIVNMLEAHQRFRGVYFYDPNQRQFFTVTGKKTDISTVRQSGPCVVLLDVRDLKQL